MRTTLLFAVGILVFSSPALALAQVDRYEVGQRLLRFDKAWDKHHQDPAAKKRALKHLLPVVPAFFAGQWPEAAQLLDKARNTLGSADEPPAAVQWAESLYAEPATRLRAKKADHLMVSVRSFYKTNLKFPDKAQVVLQFFSGDKALLPAVTTTLTELPCSINLPAELPEGDHTLRASFEVAGKVIATEEQTISVVDQLEERLTALKKGLAGLADKKSADSETTRYLASLIAALAKGDTEETNYPAARLLTESEAALKALQDGKAYYGHGKAGQFWLKLPTPQRTFVARLLAPDQAKAEKPLPLVVALHGLGASENMFFEGYGDGLIAKLCRERGWLLLSPRSGYLEFTMPVGAIVDELAKLYPVDKSKVFVVGHSMGAAQAVAEAQARPNLFAGVAALGGSGKITAAAKITKVPVLVGVGTSDFALEGARKMAQQLKDGGVANVVLKEYADVEHIMSVRESLPDAFALFDKAAKQ